MLDRDSTGALSQSDDRDGCAECGLYIQTRGVQQVGIGRRIEAAGFSNVTGLAKDTEGVWRGKAQQKTGGPVDVWLDYKGNTGLKV